jgi:hypothetical protein
MTAARVSTGKRVPWDVGVARKEEPDPIRPTRGGAEVTVRGHQPPERHVGDTHDHRAGRARELMARGDRTRAKLVAKCECLGESAGEHCDPNSCGLRQCHYCARSMVLHLRLKIEEALEERPSGRLIRLEFAARGISIRKAWRRMRHAMRGIREILGEIRTCGVVWAEVSSADEVRICAELLVAGDSFDQALLEKNWAHLSFYQGNLSVTELGPATPASVAKKLTPVARWSPRPGTVPPQMLHDLWTGMRRHRWRIAWEGRKGRVPKPARGKSQ